MIDRQTVDRIYAAANIVEIVGDYVALRKKGANYQACCPFHDEKTPSFVVSPSKGLYKCFGCGKGGNAVTFLMEHEQMTYPEALKAVAKRYGIEVQEREFTPEEQQKNDNRESMFALNAWAYDYFIKTLHETDEGRSVGLSYFRRARGMSEATIRKFGLGFCPARGDQFSRDALQAGYKKEFLETTGLSIRRDDGSLYDRFRDRVIFPIHTVSGRVVGFGGRTLRTDKQVAKYQNSPESEIYSKKRELYGLFFAKKAIQQHDAAILVEGYTDVISMHQAGVENVVSSSGTSLTTEQIRLLARFTRNITVIYDGDAAGIHASLRGIDMILAEGMNVRVVSLPAPEDPDSFARAHTAEQVQAYIVENEQDFLSFKAHTLLRTAGDDPIRRAELVGQLVDSIALVPDPIARAVYIKECARIMSMDEAVLVGEVARRRLSGTADRETEEFVRRQTRQIRTETAAEKPAGRGGSSVEALERELVRYLLKFGHCSFDFKEGKQMVACNVAEVIFGELDADGLRFRTPVYAAMLSAYREHWRLGEPVPAHLFINHADPAVCNAAVDLLTMDDNYIPSALWRRRDIHIESEAELLAAGVPKAVTLYKSKVIEGLCDELNARLKDEALSEQESSDILQRLSNLNRGKVSIARKLQRSIL